MTDPTSQGPACGRCEAQPPSSAKGAVVGSGTSIAAAAFALLPSFTCPACLAAYAGVLSAAGFGVLLRESVLRPLVVAFLVLNLLTLGWTARSHGSPAPMALALAATGCVVAGRFVLDLPWLLVVGAVGLFAAAIWNLWLKRARAGRSSATDAA